VNIFSTLRPLLENSKWVVSRPVSST
jgi:hypothetical protein